MVRLLGAPALAITMMMAAAPAAHAAHRHYAAHVGYRHYHQAAYHTGYHHDGYSRQASGRHGYQHYAFSRHAYRHDSYSSGEHAYRHYSSDEGRGRGGKPRAWCGWYARQIVGRDPGAAFNLARNWTHWGRATGPRVGAVVVWPHHVGMITGQTGDGRWIVNSGNDGNAVRERPRSLAGAIAFRES